MLESKLGPPVGTVYDKPQETGGPSLIKDQDPFQFDIYSPLIKMFCEQFNTMSIKMKP